MIQVTDAMVDAYKSGQEAGDGSIEDGLAAVLLLVERELGARAMPPELTCGAQGPGRARCERTPHLAGELHGYVGAGELVRW